MKFKSSHDLFSISVPESQSSRRTRRRLNEQRQMLRSPSAITRLSVSPPKKRRKTNNTNTDELWNVIARNQREDGKAKEELVFEKGLAQNNALDGSERSVSRFAEDISFIGRKTVNPRIAQNGEPPLVPLLSPPLSPEVMLPPTKRRRREDSPVPVTRLLSDKTQDEVLYPNGMKENLQPPVAYNESISTGGGKRAGKLRETPLHKKPQDSKVRSQCEGNAMNCV